MDITITRLFEWDTSYDVYAKATNYPLEDGDGIFVQNVTIEPWETSVMISWTPPDDRTYKIRAVPLFRRSAGFGGPIT